MKQLQQEFLNEARQNMLTPEGAESLHDDDITEIAGILAAGISGGAWAVMDEYGTGHMMDSTNPSLQDYKDSNLWNPLRQSDNYIRGRPAGKYTDIFGNEQNSSGKMAGRIIEYPQGSYIVHPPSHAVKTAQRWMQNGRMKDVVLGVVRTFPFGRFIITDRK